MGMMFKMFWVENISTASQVEAIYESESKEMFPLSCYFILFGGKKAVRAWRGLSGIQMTTDIIFFLFIAEKEHRL